ncbi:MAG: carboxypeptidase regulatory-like domain-containing protein [Terriglobales bacterium]
MFYVQWKSRLLPVFVAFTFLVLAIPRSRAQAATATISGTVTDPAGRAVPGAHILLSSLARGTTTVVTSNSVGVYLFAVVQPGSYDLTVTKSGFASALVKGLNVAVEARQEQNVQLALASATQSVTVTGGQPPVNTQDATVGTVIGRGFVSNMPLNGRSYQSLIELTPGVVVTPVSAGSSGQFSINGQRPDSNYFTVDGVSANIGVASAGSILAGSAGAGVQPSAGGGYNNLVSVDALQEFKIQTSTFAPEFGNSPGGQISMVTRSGTNQFHGDAFDYLRNTVLDANDWFLNSVPPKPGTSQHPPEQQNDFGGVFGGPLLRNRLFVFASYEGLRLLQPTPLLTYVPSTCARGGGGCPATGSNNTPAPAAMIPFLNAYPQPTTGGCGGAERASTDNALAALCQGYSGQTSMNSTSVRVDYAVNSHMSAFARFDDAPSSSASRKYGATSLVTNGSNYESITGGFTDVFSPALVNDTRFNYTFVTGDADSVVDNFQGAAAIPGSNPILFPSAVQIPGGLGAVTAQNSRFIFELPGGASWRTGEETHNQSHQLQLLDSASFLHGTHQFKFGVDFRRLTPVQARSGYQQTYSFLTTADMLAGTVGTYASAFNPLSKFVWHELGLYAQDTWSENRISITYGLRWEFDPAPGTLNSVPYLALQGPLDLGNPASIGVAPIGTRTYTSQRNAFAPRLGIAYQLSTDPNWGRVVRLGWGLFFDNFGDAASFLSTFGEPTASVVTQPFPATPYDQNPANLAPNPNAAPWPNITAANPGLRMPYTFESSLAFEQSLGRAQSLTLTYTGADAHNLFLTEAFDSPNAALPQGFNLLTNLGSSSYNSLQVLFQRTLANNFQIMTSYVWSHSIDTGSNEDQTVPNVALLPLATERGNSDFDIPQSFQFGATWNVPGPAQGAFRPLLHGWGLDTIFRASDGAPLNLIDSKVRFPQFLPNVSVDERPNLVGGVPLYLSGSACTAVYKSCPGGTGLNPNAFSVPAAGVQGTLGRNAVRGPGWNELDLTLRRQIALTERWGLQLRADAFNVLNHPNFRLSGNSLNIASPGFGVAAASLANSMFANGGTPGFNPLYQAGGPRSVQLSLKLVF